MITPYKQAFLFVMETGAIALSVVCGEDSSHGLGLAQSQVMETLDGQIWDSCAYPMTHDMPEGLTVLRNEES